MRQYYLRQRKSGGIFHVTFIDSVTGKQTVRTTGTADEKKAEAVAQGWLLNGLPDKPRVSTIARKTTFCDFLFQFWDFETSGYFRELETMGKQPYEDHPLEMQKIVNRYYRPYFQSKLLYEIDEENLREFIVYLKTKKKNEKGEKYSTSTVNSTRNTAIVALKYAKRKKIIKSFDFDSVIRAGGKGKKRGILEQDEVDKLFRLGWPNTLSRIAALIAVHTGMRMGEIRALKVGDIYKDKIIVSHSWSRKSKEKCTKNRETREIPILTSVYAEIMTYINQMRGFSSDSLLLPGKNPKIPYSAKEIGKDFNKMLELIGIDDNTRKERGIVFHSSRHLIAFKLVKHDVNKAIGMKILGHKTSYIFDRYADHTDKDTFNQMANAIAKLEQRETL